MKKLIGLFSLVAILSSCSLTKKIASIESSLQQAYNSQQYTKVLSNYAHLASILKKREMTISSSYLLMAAKSAYHLEEYETAIQLFSKIEEKDDKSIYMEGKSYQKLHHLESEYKYWKENSAQLKNDENYQEVLQRLYWLEIEFFQYDAAYSLWDQLEETDDEALMTAQLKVLEELEKNEEALSISNKILDKNPANEEALFYKGKIYFNRAEKLYQSEMTKYNQNPNYTTYAYLKRELKKVSADFRLSRDLFEKLHELSPENKTYITYLKNCYVRLEMKAEAAKMDRLLD